MKEKVFEKKRGLSEDKPPRRKEETLQR